LKAVFITRDSLLQEAGPQEAQDARLRAGVPESLRLLADNHLFTILLDPRPHRSGATEDAAAPSLLELLRAKGGKVDALLECPHAPEDHCGCWSAYPGFLYAAAAQLELRLDECYLLCSGPNDVHLAGKVGCRPILVLDGHTIGELYGGHQPEPADFPVARDVASAVQYVLCEEEAAERVSHARQPTRPSQPDEETAPAGEMPEFSPKLTLLSPVRARKGLLLPAIPPLSQSARRWLLMYILGGVWLSLGIAYLLTHLYRVQHFPEWVWYLTLQFIPRPVRGLLFIMSGVALVFASLRSFLRLMPGGKQE
jgi:D-glycero-D-manno-heptose 1,7-bisphosphate phosphatase